MKKSMSYSFEIKPLRNDGEGSFLISFLDLAECISVRNFSITFLLVFFCLLARAQPIPYPPLDCPQCGDWDVSRAQPSGSVGERLSINSERVIIPTCGEFAATVVNQSMTTDATNNRTYQVTMALQQVVAESVCATSPEVPIRLEIRIGVGYNRDGGFADFQVFKPDQSRPILVAGAWNFMRDDPCGSGSGNGSASCMQIAIAKKYKALAYEVFDAHASVKPQVSAALAKQLNLASFSAATFRFCLKREAQSGGGNWPYVWALSCQATRLDDKLIELRAWRTCHDQKRSSCRPITHKFDKSPSDVER